MYKYTPKEEILRDIRRSKAKKKRDLRYDLQSDIEAIFKRFHCTSWFSIEAFCKTEFYSKEKRQMIPVEGLLAPVQMFNEEVVDN